MDFFEHQDAARKSTVRLVVLFVASVLAIMVLVYLAVAVLVTGLELRGAGPARPRSDRGCSIRS